MHTVLLLEQALGFAKQAGYEVRQDWFGGTAAGACELRGRRWLFVDLSLSPDEQLDQVLSALGGAGSAEVQVAPELQRMLQLRKVA